MTCQQSHGVGPAPRSSTSGYSSRGAGRFLLTRTHSRVEDSIRKECSIAAVPIWNGSWPQFRGRTIPQMRRFGAKMSYISVPAGVPAASVNALLVLSPKKGNRGLCNVRGVAANGSFWLALMAACACIGMLKLLLPWRVPGADLCSKSSLPHELGPAFESRGGPLPPHALGALNLTEGEKRFWEQPPDLGYAPCLVFSAEYRRRKSAPSDSARRKYLMVVVAGGLNQQRNQIVDAVVIARILDAALVVPVMQVNVIWGDDSEFSDIFDVEHFKKVLEADVRIVSSLPSTHLMSRPVVENRTPLHVTARWIRSRYLRRLNREGVLLLRGLDSRLAKDLPPDLQKLRCKVAFHALRFAAPIQSLGSKLAERMWRQGPYLALHLRLEKDVWVRTGCLPGLDREYDHVVEEERILRPNLLTGRSNMTYRERKVAGLCPLNAMEVARLLKALGASRRTRIYWAGGEPLGGAKALEPLIEQFPLLFNKQSLALHGELEPYLNKSSVLAAIDYIVSLNSDIFLASHGGNMGRAIQGHRAYAGHRKHLTPNKREVFRYLMDTTLSEEDFNHIIRELHNQSYGQPVLRTDKIGRDVIAYPVPECMCTSQPIH